MDIGGDLPFFLFGEGIGMHDAYLAAFRMKIIDEHTISGLGLHDPFDPLKNGGHRLYTALFLHIQDINAHMRKMQESTKLHLQRLQGARRLDRTCKRDLQLHPLKILIDADLPHFTWYSLRDLRQFLIRRSFDSKLI